MSSLFICAPTTGQPTSFVPFSAPALLDRLSSATHANWITAASRLQVRPAPELVTFGISQVDVLTGGLPRGCLTEICGLPSSGRTSVLLSVIAAASQRREACALVDVSNALDPGSGDAAGINLQQLLWIRCNDSARPPQGPRVPAKSGNKSDMARMAQALKVTDLLVQSSGFGLIAIDLGDLPYNISRRIPLASWFRFRRAVENTPTVLLVVSQAPCASTCASLLLRLESSVINRQSSANSQASYLKNRLSGFNDFKQKIMLHNFPNYQQLENCKVPAHARMLEGISIHVQLERSRLPRKAPRPDKTFQASTRWYAEL